MKLPLTIAAFIVLFAGAMYFGVLPIAQGSTDYGNYRYRAITSSNASSTAPVVVSRVEGTLGSIVIASSSAATLGVYDSSSATTTGATLITKIKASAGENTYTFDVGVEDGIVLDVPAAFNGMYTITYR